MKTDQNDTTSLRMRSSGHSGDSKMSKKDTHAAEFKAVTLLNILTKLGTLVYDAYG